MEASLDNRWKDCADIDDDALIPICDFYFRYFAGKSDDL